MRLIWSGPALRDLDRLYAFLAPKSAPAAARIVQSITAGSQILVNHPRVGVRLSKYTTEEIRHIIIGDYDLRYEVGSDVIRIVRLWHVMENR